jgi:AraC family transcriptional regulator
MDLSRIQIISCETGDAGTFTALEVGIASGDRWSGVRVQTMLGTGPGELAESYLPRHVVTVGASRRLSAHWHDGPTIENLRQNPADTVCIFPAMQPYQASWDSDCRSIFVELAPELFDETTRSIDRNGRTMLRPGLAPDDHFIPPLAAALVDLAARDESGTRLLAESLGITLAAHLAQAHSTSQLHVTKQPGPLTTDKLRAVKEFIDAHLESPISLSDLASQVEMSVFHFARCFRQSTGVAPYQFVTRRRIELAQKLLRNPDLSVADVAVRCGFSQQSHFGEVFRRVLGLSPREYRAAAGVFCSGTGTIR